MKEVLSEAGRSFLRAFIGSLLVFVPGLLAAPDMNSMLALAVSALAASVAAGIKVLQVFVPALSFASLVGERAGVYVDSFARAFIGVLVVLLPGALEAPNLGEARALLVAAIVAAVTAGVRALQGFLPNTEDPQQVRMAGRATQA